MSRHFNLPLRPLGLILALSAAAIAHAGDPVTDAMQAANAPYRAALYQTNSGQQTAALQAVVQAQQAWERLSTQFGGQPPSPYDRDPAFKASVNEVTTVYTKALAQAQANQLSDAHDTLEHVRDVMADMRQRSQVVVFSDHMNAYHAQMEHILIEGKATLSQPNGMLKLTAQTGALSYLAARLEAQAAPNLATNAEFAALLKAVLQSVHHLEAALLNQDSAAVQEAIGKLKGPYSKLFLKFG